MGLQWCCIKRNCWEWEEVKVQVYSLESSQNLSPDFTIITKIIIGNRPTLMNWAFFGLWQSHGCTFRKVTISSQLLINSGLTVTHVDPYLKDSPQPLEISLGVEIQTQDPFILSPPPHYLCQGIRTQHWIGRIRADMWHLMDTVWKYSRMPDSLASIK